MKDDIKTHSLASLAAGTVATTICAPFDVLKSRIQAASAVGGSSVSKLTILLPGTAFTDNLKSISSVISAGLREEGPRFLMKGWTPAWLRLT